MNKDWKNDPVEVVIQHYSKKIVRTKYSSPQQVLKVYLSCYKEYADSEWSISSSRKQQMLSDSKRMPTMICEIKRRLAKVTGTKSIQERLFLVIFPSQFISG